MAAKKRKPARRHVVKHKQHIPEAHAEVCDTSRGNVAIFGTKSFVHDVLAAINPLLG